MAGTPALQTVIKTIRVLEAVMDQDSDHVTLAALTHSLGWSRGATHQYLSSLVKAGWLQQDAQRRYQLASKAAVFGRYASEHAGVPPAVSAVMAELVSRLQEPISFAVLQGREAVIVERVEPQRPFAIQRGAELRMALRSASGQVLVAFDRRRSPALAGEENSDEIRARVREAGYATTSARWMGDFVEAVAVPIMDGEDCLGALSAVAPEGRMNVPEAVGALLSARQDVEASLHSEHSERSEEDPR